MSFDEAAPTRCLVKQHHFQSTSERNGMNFDDAREAKAWELRKRARKKTALLNAGLFEKHNTELAL